MRRLFKGLMSPRFVAGACLTGILPIKALDTLSGLDDVRESTMLAPSELAPFVGFTNEEVHLLCCNRDVNCTALQQ